MPKPIHYPENKHTNTINKMEFLTGYCYRRKNGNPVSFDKNFKYFISLTFIVSEIDVGSDRKRTAQEETLRKEGKAASRTKPRKFRPFWVC